MTSPSDWAIAYANQADADFRAWELYQIHPEAVAAECHKLLFLQMACEKLCKAYLCRPGVDLESLQKGHGFIANPLPKIVEQQFLHAGGKPEMLPGLMTHVRHLANEIEVLNPSMKRGGKREDNCEYPWQAGDRVLSPLDQSFSPSQLCLVPAGRTFLVLLRGAIDRIRSA